MAEDMSRSVEHNLAVIRDVQAQIDAKVDTATTLAILHKGRAEREAQILAALERRSGRE